MRKYSRLVNSCQIGLCLFMVNAQNRILLQINATHYNTMHTHTQIQRNKHLKCTIHSPQSRSHSHSYVHNTAICIEMKISLLFMKRAIIVVVINRYTYSRVDFLLLSTWKQFIWIKYSFQNWESKNLTLRFYCTKQVVLVLNFQTLIVDRFLRKMTNHNVSTYSTPVLMI